MKKIPLTQGKFALVDDGDYSDLIRFKWQYHMGYAKRGMKCIKMHRQIFKLVNVPPRIEIDHINGNKLDNRRCNLRICNRSQNVKHVSKRKDTKNTYKGVHFVKNRNKWIARIQIDGHRIHSGYYPTQIEAAKRYDQLAKRFHREFAYLNFPL